MQRLVGKFIVTLLLLLCITLYPSAALAADFSFNINVVRQDGATCGELWLNDRLVWRLALLSDGAKPVSSGSTANNTTLIIPDIVKGMFVIKVE